jgi:hypothetical protein
MNTKDVSANLVRLLLGVVGAGTVGATFEAAQASNDIFARPFLSKGAEMTIPAMVYDPVLQMMVDPVTRAPVYMKKIKTCSSQR